MTASQARRRLASGWTHRPVAGVLLLVICAVLPACTIPIDDNPRDIPTDEQRGLPLADVDAGRATGAGRIYLLARGQSGRPVLQSVPREEAGDPEEALRTLFDGPNGAERKEGITSLLPDTIRLRTAARQPDTLSINVTSELLDLTGDGAIQALAQIVATVSEFDDIKSVWLRVDGEKRSWPDSDGNLQADALTIFDYADLIESAQPSFPPIPSQR